MEKETYYRAIGNKILSVTRTETGKYKVNHVYTDPFGRILPKQGEVSKDYVDWLLSNKKD
jgi:hypothetical protein